jgi:hypothetical protein
VRNGNASDGRRALLAATVLLAACTSTPALIEGEPKVVKDVDIHAYEHHEECLHLGVGERLDYEFTSNQPLDFNIHYHEGKMVLMPIVKDKSQRDSGIFAPLLDYRIVLRRAAK